MSTFHEEYPTITVCEVWTRDGIQAWHEPVSVEDKLAIITGVVAAGVREVDATSLVSLRATAQFTDAEELMAKVAESDLRATFRALVVNTRSFDRIAASEALRATVGIAGFPISASEAHNVANLHKTHAEHLEQLARMIDRSLELGIEPLMCVATAYGCPISGVVPRSKVLELASWGYQRGVRKIMLGDTTGMADPRHAHELFTLLATELPEAELLAHFHDTRGSGIANTLAAIDAGVRTVDASLGGMGGEPPTVEQNHSGESGNVCTEDLVAVLARMGYDTGIDLTALLDVGRRVEAICRTPLRSQVLKTGLAVPAR